MSRSMLVRMNLAKTAQAVEIVGDPGWIRTSDLQLRRLLLYPLSYGTPGTLLKRTGIPLAYRLS
jgi:hypothetical protein